jgi:MSHA biogenesis protein MshK
MKGLLIMLVLATGYAFALEDPTRPSGFAARAPQSEPAREFSLASIFIGNNRRLAVIDGEVRREGQVFEGIRIRRIYPDRVELVDQGSVRVLRLEPLPQVRSPQ